MIHGGIGGRCFDDSLTSTVVAVVSALAIGCRLAQSVDVAVNLAVAVLAYQVAIGIVV